jgi:hypothetical protein
MLEYMLCWRLVFHLRCPEISICTHTSLTCLLIQIDDYVVSRVEKLGFDHNHLIDCLHRQETTKATVTYYLLLDAQHSENQNDYLESKCEELEARACSHEDPTPSISALPVIANHQLQSSTDDSVHVIHSEQKQEGCSIVSPTSIAPSGNWTVGLQVLSFT